ncbi:MAG TPA: nucleoside hydrolase [Roseiarcus sp.]|nr:nucleoside hydrolase [Roseiarcus sp.]
MTAETLLLIDVDTGIDDALALLHACASPEANILGVTTVAGNVDLQRATRNTRAVLALAGRPDIPVWPGCAKPILREAEDASAVHGGSGLGHAVLPDPPPLTDARHAVDQILALARAHAGDLVLVPTGPLTNVAAALTREPALVKWLKRLVLMGGAFTGGGNTTPAAEFNIWHDPEAARIVFRAFAAEGAAPLVAVGLDVTRKVLLTPDDLSGLAKRVANAPRGAALMRFLEDATRHYFEFIEQREGRRFFVMHDPLALAAALDLSLIETQSVAVDVETTGALTSGMTVADWRGVWRRKPNAEVAVGVRAEATIAQFIERMERLAKGG